jgi:hypothetical protein
MAHENTDAAIAVLDDATRPKAPKIEGITPRQRQSGKRLALIHDYHLAQIDEVRSVMDQVEAGAQSAAALAGAISALQMTANYRLFGKLCGRECRMLTLHHTIEDDSMFPALAGGGDGLKKVVDRLKQEHLVIHRLLEALQAAAENAVGEPGRDTFSELKAAFLALERFVRSHFGYEQEELEEALGYYAVPL